MPLTNQVDNVTETNLDELSTQEDYDKEWDDDDASDQSIDESNSEEESNDDSSEDGDHEKAEETATAGSGTVDGENHSTPNVTADSSAESNDAGDIWADATDAQRLAFKKAQNELNRETGRARSQQQRNADLEKELKTTKSEYSEATREKGAYELEHPQLFDEVLGRLKNQQGVPAPADSPVSERDEPSEDIKVVFKVHPDAHDLMQTPEWGTFASGLTDEQKVQLESDNPFEFIDLLSEFKTVRRISAASGSTPDDLSDTLTSAGGSSSSASGVNKRRLSIQESYDREWDEG
jgi:hypothetical protein